MSRPLHRLRFPPGIAATIAALHPHLKHRVRAALAGIFPDPRAGKPLREDLAGLWNYPVGQARIVYRIAAGRIVELVAAGPRETIYRTTYRLLKRGPDKGP